VPTGKKKISSVLALLLLIIGATFLVQNTLAASINLNSGAPVEFGQGVAQTTACSNGDSLIVTPISTFTNSGDGSFSFTGVTVSDIPESCEGVDFAISAYDTTGDALAIFNTDSTVATIWNDGGTFKLGTGSVNGASITSGTGAFTFSFTEPVALATNVSRVTLQSSAHAAYSCATDLICNVGDISASGGTVFYKSESAFTVTGTICDSNCHYLEWAPGDWNGGTKDSGVSVNFWRNGTTHVGISEGIPGLMSEVTRDEFGYGYENTNALIVAGDTSGASTLARGYAGPLGNTAGQWFIGSKAELYLARNNSSAYNGNEFTNQVYFTSSQSLGNLGACWSVGMGPTNGNAYTQNCNVNNPSKVRPFRAF
jgi:hypothetical protein